MFGDYCPGEPDAWTWPDAYEEPEYEGSDDCPHCEGDGCVECDFTGGYDS